MPDNSFEVPIPEQYRITVDSRIWSTKLDDSWHLDRIVKWLLDNRKHESQEILLSYGTNVSQGILDILAYLVDCEKTIHTINDMLKLKGR